MGERKKTTPRRNKNKIGEENEKEKKGAGRGGGEALYEDCSRLKETVEEWKSGRETSREKRGEGRRQKKDSGRVRKFERE